MDSDYKFYITTLGPIKNDEVFHQQFSASAQSDGKNSRWNKIDDFYFMPTIHQEFYTDFVFIKWALSFMLQKFMVKKFFPTVHDT